MRRNRQHFRRNTSRSDAQLLNLRAPVHAGGLWPPKRHCTQKVKQCTRNLSRVANCNMLKLPLITFSKMLVVFIICSLFLPDPVYKNIHNTGLCDGKNLFFICLYSPLATWLTQEQGHIIFTLDIPLCLYLLQGS
jgi:hypothetical protein